MTIKLLLLKSGEDIIADVSEMAFGEDEKKRVVGYFLKQPCVVKMRKPMVNPMDKLEQMYIDDILNYEQDNQNTSTDNESESD